MKCMMFDDIVDSVTGDIYSTYTLRGAGVDRVSTRPAGDGRSDP
jgi:hypothetical protein